MFNVADNPLNHLAASLVLDSIGILDEKELVQIFVDVIRDHCTYYDECNEFHRDLRPENIMHSRQDGEVEGFLIDLDDLPLQDPVLRDSRPPRYTIASGFYHFARSENVVYRHELRAFCNILQWAIKGSFYRAPLGAYPWKIRFETYFGCPKKSRYLLNIPSPALEELYKSLTRLSACADFFSREGGSSEEQEDALNWDISYASIMDILRSCEVQDTSLFDLRLAAKTPLPSPIDGELSPALKISCLSYLSSLEELKKVFIDVIKDHYAYHQQTDYVNGRLSLYYVAYTRDISTQEPQGIFVDLDPLLLLQESPEHYLPSFDPTSLAFAAYDALPSSSQTNQVPKPLYYRHDLESLLHMLLWSKEIRRSNRYYAPSMVKDQTRGTVDSIRQSRKELLEYFTDCNGELQGTLRKVIKVIADAYWFWENDLYSPGSFHSDLGGLFTYERVLKALESS